MSENIVFENKRKNPFCVISTEVFGEHYVHDIQTNSSWTKCPYENYVAVPDDMVESILATGGFCDIVLNEDGTEVVSFTAREIPVIPEPEAVPSELDLLKEENATLKEELLSTQLAVAELAEIVMGV